MIGGMEAPTNITTQVVQKLGGPVQAARKLGIKHYQSVQQWTYVPARHCNAVERLTGVDRKTLRPHDWQAYWPDLAQEPADA